MGKIEMINVHNQHFPLGVITFIEEERIKEMENNGFELLKKKEIKKHKIEEVKKSEVI